MGNITLFAVNLKKIIFTFWVLGGFGGCYRIVFGKHSQCFGIFGCANACFFHFLLVLVIATDTNNSWSLSVQ